MSKRGVSLNPGYISGSHWAICDRCGSQFRAEDLRETWDNLWVCEDDWETRHPQDFIRVKAERISVDQPIRPEDTSNLIASAQTIGSITTTAATFGHTSGVASIAEAGRAICNTRELLAGTFSRETL